MHNNLVDSYKYFTIDFRNLKKGNNVTLNSNIILVKSVTLSKILLAVNNLSIFRIRINRIYVKRSLSLVNLPLKRTRLSMEHDRMNSLHMPLLLS